MASVCLPPIQPCHAKPHAAPHAPDTSAAATALPQFQSILVQSMYDNIVALPPKAPHQESEHTGLVSKLPSIMDRHDASDSEDEGIPCHPLTRNDLSKSRPSTQRGQR